MVYKVRWMVQMCACARVCASVRACCIVLKICMWEERKVCVRACMHTQANEVAKLEGGDNDFGS